MLTQQRLRELLDYDPITGCFWWREQEATNSSANGPRNRWAEQEAGATTVQGYRIVSVDNERFRACRLAWLYMTGEWPTNDIDHRNGNQADDRWENLRSATKAQNMQNAKMRADNKSGARGVSWNKRKQKWHVRVNADGMMYHCGYFDDFDKAVAVRDAKAIQLHGAFVRLNQLTLTSKENLS